MSVKRNNPIEIVGTNENIPAADVVIATPSTGDPGLVVYQDGFGTTVIPVFVTNGGSGGTASAFGAPFPPSGTAAGALDVSGNMAALNLDAAGNLKVTGDSGGGSVTIISPLDGAGNVEVNLMTALPAGTNVIGHVIVDSGAITVAGTVLFSNTTIEVTNTGTFAVQATLSAETTKIIGTVNQGTSPWVVSGAVTVGTPTVNQGTNPWVCSIPTDVEVVQDTAADFLCTASLASGSNVIGKVSQDTSPWVVSGAVTVSGTVAFSNTTIAVTNTGTFAVQEATLDATIVAQGTTASAKILIVGGKTNDATAQYREIPEGAGGRSVIIEGVAGGTAVPVSGTVAFSNTTIAVTNTGTFAVQAACTQSTSPWVVAGNLDEDAAVGSTNLAAMVAHATATRDVHTQGTYALLHVDLEGFLRTRLRAENLLGDVSIAPRNNQIEINFATAFVNLPLTNTHGGTGTTTQANGQATYASGVTSGGRATGVTMQSLFYRPGHVLYSMFSAGFSTGGTGAGFQRLGPYSDGADGFFIGYEGSVFTFTQLNAGVATGIARSSWNGDPLDGSANSAFTSGGTPVAINFSKVNIYKISGSWFGTAPIRLEVLSPDSEWVICHTLRFPNTLTAPYASTTTWPITVDVQSASNTPVSIYTPCWALGTQDQNFGLVDTITDNTLAVLGRSVLVGKNAAGSYANVSITPDSALSVGGSGDTHVTAATWTSTTGSTITPLGGATNAASTNVTTLTATYTPTAGADHAIVVSFNAGNSYTNLVVQDNLGHTLTAGPTIGNVASFYQFPVPAGAITGYTATWTTGRQSTICVEEYSGVNAVNATLVGNTASATSNTASITVIPNEGGDVIVCALGNSSGDTMTGTVGNTRQTVSTSTARAILMDTTGGTCTATHTSDTWSAIAIGLRPTIISGTALNTALVMVNNSFAYNSVAVELVGTGTFVLGAVTSEVSINNVNWIGLIGVNTGTGTAGLSSVFTLTSTATGLVFNITGYNYFRLRLSTQIAGFLGQVVISYNIQGLSSPNVSSTITNGPITVNDNQGLPNTLPNAWPFYITDTANGPVAVKAASTAALATDAALVVAISPNNTVDMVGHIGGIFDAVVGAAAPANGVMVGGSDGSAFRVFSTNSAGQLGVTTVASGLVAPGTAPTDAAIVGAQYKVTAPAPTDTQTLALQTDRAGDLKVMQGIASFTGTAWATATALNTTQVVVSNTGAPAILVQLVQTTTITVGEITFEGTYDDTNWITVPAGQVLDPATLVQISIPYTLQASTNKAFLVSLGGFRQIRLKLSTAITGSGTVTPFITQLGYDPLVIAKALGPVTPGTAASQSELAGGVVATSAPAGTAAQQMALQMDVAGCLRINPAGQTGSFKSATATGATGTNNVVLTVPANKKWVVKSVLSTITCSATVTTRSIPFIQVLDAASNKLALIVSNSGLTAVDTAIRTITYGPGMNNDTAFQSGSAGTAFPEMVLGPGCTITVEWLTNFQVGDVMSVAACVEEYND